MAYYQSRPLSLQQNRYARRTLLRRRQSADHEAPGCAFFCLMCVCKVTSVFTRRSRKMKLYYQILALIGIGLVFLCLSRVLTNTAEDEHTYAELQKNVQSYSRPIQAVEKEETAHVDRSGKSGKPLYEKAAVCGNRWQCRLGQLGFNLRAGFENTEKPYVCLNNKEVFKSEECGRGLNLVVVDAKVKDVIITRHVDTYTESPSTLVDFLHKIAPGDVLIAVTADDAYRKLSKEIKDIISRDFNSQMIGNLSYRSSWIFVGQKGVRSSVQLEQLNLVHGHWPEKTELRGCLSLPMDTNTSTIEQHRDLASNCNQPDCGNGLFPVSVVTGAGTGAVRQTPTVCVDGKQVMAAQKIKDYEPGSRGLNCFIFDPKTMKVIKVGRFDTYMSTVDDTLLQNFLSSLEDGQIVIIATHDEATKRLSVKSKEMIKDLGSSKMDDFSFRDNWILVSQKGIDGFSPYEKLSFRQGSGWGHQLEIKECIPLQMKGVAVVSHIVSKKRADFCRLYDTYHELCAGDNVNKTLKPLPIDDISLRSNPAYNLPIVVVPGVDLVPLQKCLSSLLAVPGLKPSNVLVILNGNYPEPNDLVKLYDFRIEYIKPKADYEAFLHDAIKRAFELLKGKENLIILEDYLEVTPDFLRYFSQTYQVFAKDPTILTISAWNPNGFSKTSGDESLVYRTENFPGFGWIARRTLWTDQLSAQKECCKLPTWRGWTVAGGESIIPDVSRIKRIARTGGYYEDKRLLTDFLQDRRSSSASTQSEPTEVYKVLEKMYEQEMERLISKSIPLKPETFTKCLQGAKLSLTLKSNHAPNSSRNIYAVFYNQDKLDDHIYNQGKPENHSLLRKLCKCFGLFVFEDSPLSNLHKGVIRFTYQGSHVILVGSKTVYFGSKPKSAEVLSNIDDKG